jgi:hypothetical protein
MYFSGMLTENLYSYGVMESGGKIFSDTSFIIIIIIIIIITIIIIINVITAGTIVRQSSH